MSDKYDEVARQIQANIDEWIAGPKDGRTFQGIVAAILREASHQIGADAPGMVADLLETLERGTSCDEIRLTRGLCKEYLAALRARLASADSIAEAIVAHGLGNADDVQRIALLIRQGYAEFARAAPSEETHLPWREALDIANAEIAELRAALASERDKYDGITRLRDLLAIIHRDGGHHTAEVGLIQSVEDAKKLIASERAKGEGEAKQIPDGLLLTVARAAYAAGRSNILARPTRENICKAWGYTVRPSPISEYPKELDMGPESDKDCPLCGAIVRNARPAPDATALREADFTHLASLGLIQINVDKLSTLIEALRPEPRELPRKCIDCTASGLRDGPCCPPGSEPREEQK